jgi:hypothetical protein
MKRLIARVVFWTIAAVLPAIVAGGMACLVVAASTATRNEVLDGAKQAALIVGVATATVFAFIWAHENK